MQPIFYRPADSTDITHLVVLLEKLFTIEADFCFSAEKQERGLAMLLQSTSATILVAQEDCTIVGMVSGQLIVSTAEGGPALLVEDLIVETSRRGRGIGRQLLLHIGNWAYSQGASRLQLLADRDNHTGLRFYSVTGWQLTRLICLRKYHKGDKK